MKLEQTHVNSLLEAAGVETLSVEEESKIGMVVRVMPEQVHPTLLALRDGDLSFEMLLDTFGADLGAEAELPIEVTYHLRSLTNDIDIRVKTCLPYDGEYHSVIDIFQSVYLPERELCEMFGLFLEDHPNPKRLLTNPELITPLRKSFQLRGKEDIWSRY